MSDFDSQRHNEQNRQRYDDPPGPLKVGDWVRFGGWRGQVLAIHADWAWVDFENEGIHLTTNLTRVED